MSLDRNDKQALLEWEDFRQAVSQATSVDVNETAAQQKKRIKTLEADDEAWFKYYFPNFYKAEPADFHKKATRRIMQNAEWYEVRAWSRELAKSTRSMMEDLKLMLTKKKRYKLLISNSYDNACRLLKPYMINLESNNRIINDYGIQQKIGSWAEGDLTTRSNFSMRALGAGQSPRGTRKDEQRPDIIEFDDFDTDEECLNIDIIDKKWKWVNEAAIPTRSVSVPTLIRWNGNFIAEDCCVVRACEYADKVDKINIRDENGVSTWGKNSEAMIDRILSTITYSAQQKEYYNNPYNEGKVFKEITYGKCPPLKDLPFIIIYADPSTSNKDRPTVRSKAQNSCKAVVIVGKKDLKYYVYNAFVDITKNSTFVDWLYSANDEVKDKAKQAYTYIENNSLQDPFYEQVLLPMIFQKGKERGKVLGITPDERKKAEKFFRIEGTLEPKNRLGLLIFNSDQKDNPHMKRLEAQFKSVGPNSKTMDGPDAVEGAVTILDNKIVAKNSGVKVIRRKPNNKRY